LRSRLDEADNRLSRLEVTGLASYRAVVTFVQRAELVERLGAVIRDRTRTLGDEGRIATLQLNDLLSGVSTTEELVLQDYIKPLRSGAVGRALERLDELSGPELEDASRVAKELGFSDLDDPAEARGHRLLSKVGRLPDAVREDIVRYFGSVTRLLRATEEQLIDVEGVGETRSEQVLSIFTRLVAESLEWEQVLDLSGRAVHFGTVYG
jgi:diadenylate cyclase